VRYGGAALSRAIRHWPLLQAWFSAREPGRSPYRLYALSNLGSLLGLLTYPFLIEILVPLRGQALIWSIGYALFTPHGLERLATGAYRRHTPSSSVRSTDDAAPPPAA